MKRIWYILFVAVFFLACLAPSVGMMIAGPSQAAANEAPAAAPKFIRANGAFNENVLSDLQTYMSNGFFGRLNLITAWDGLCAKVFNTSANDDVLIGPDGWLFYGGAVNDISGANQMTDREIWCAARSLYLMQEYAQNQGAEFIFTIPCGKYTLYPEHAPSYVTVAEGSNRERLVAALAEQGVNYADLYDAFTAVDEELYWQLDSHWNGRGAALAADAILAGLGESSDYFGGPFAAEPTHTGDLYEMLYPTGTVREWTYIWSPGFTFDYVSDFHTYDDISIETENPDVDGSLLMFRDSSGRNLYPYMAQSYGRAFFSRLNNYRLDFIAGQEADTVVVELAERTVNYLLRYPAVYPAPERDTSVLDNAIPVGGDTQVDDSGSTMEGYAKLTGTLPDTAIDSPVYVEVDGAVYEAIPNEGSFTAWLPMEMDWQNAQVYIHV